MVVSMQSSPVQVSVRVSPTSRSGPEGVTLTVGDTVYMRGRGILCMGYERVQISDTSTLLIPSHLALVE